MLMPDEHFLFLLITHVAPLVICQICVMCNFHFCSLLIIFRFSGMRQWCHMPDDHSHHAQKQNGRISGVHSHMAHDTIGACRK